MKTNASLVFFFSFNELIILFPLILSRSEGFIDISNSATNQTLNKHRKMIWFPNLFNHQKLKQTLLLTPINNLNEFTWQTKWDYLYTES